MMVHGSRLIVKEIGEGHVRGAYTSLWFLKK